MGVSGKAAKRRARTNTHRAERGFSLVEMLAALAVFALVSVMMTGVVASTSRAHGRAADFENERQVYALAEAMLDRTLQEQIAAPVLVSGAEPTLTLGARQLSLPAGRYELIGTEPGTARIVLLRDGAPVAVARRYVTHPRNCRHDPISRRCIDWNG